MTYVGYKVPRYSPGSTPWGTLVARNGSRPALWVSGDPAAKRHPQDTSRQKARNATHPETCRKAVATSQLLALHSVKTL